eukprot:365180-Chlamydomonas_euryale.AAC.3
MHVTHPSGIPAAVPGICRGAAGTRPSNRRQKRTSLHVHAAMDANLHRVSTAVLQQPICLLLKQLHAGQRG